MKINFEMLVDLPYSLGWTKTVALIRNGLETDILTEVECELALTKLKAIFEHYNWFELQQEQEWYVAFNATAFDLGKPFTIERESNSQEYQVAAFNKNMQQVESVGEPVSVHYPVMGDGATDCIMVHGVEA